MDLDSIAARVKCRRLPSPAFSSLLELEAERRMSEYHRRHRAAAAKALLERRPFSSATCAMRKGESHVQHYERFLKARPGNRGELLDWQNFVRTAS